jgi:UDP-3-O-[3-hydroxymyristoyl] glucosamine N-acyltransferase
MVDRRFYKHLGPFTLVDLLDGLDVEIPEGQFGDIQIENAAPVNLAGVSDLSFFEGRKAAAEKLSCQAVACFVTAENAPAIGGQGAVAIISKAPRADFAKILDRMYRSHSYDELQDHPPVGVNIAKGAIIAADAAIGTGSSIGPNAVVGPGVIIGNNCKIGANAVVEFSTLGDNCVVHNGAVIGGTGFGVAMTADGCVDIPHVGSVKIGDNVSVGNLTTIDRAMFGETQIGDGCKFDNLVQIAHNVKIGKNCRFAAFVGLSGSCNVGDNVVMGGRVGIPDHINVGDGAMMAANSATMRDIPAGGYWSGVPAMPVREHMRQVTMLKKMLEKKSK